MQLTPEDQAIMSGKDFIQYKISEDCDIEYLTDELYIIKDGDASSLVELITSYIDESLEDYYAAEDPKINLIY